MVRGAIRIILAFLTLCGTVSQQAPRTLVQLRVDDGHGAAIPRAKIELSQLPGASSGLSAETDNEGNAGFEVSAGSYQVLVSRESFCPHRWSVTIPSQGTLKLGFSLRVGPCHVSSVVVLGDPDTDQVESPGPISETSLLNVLVTDFTGARVSNADVQARCADSGLTVESTGDEKGQALVALGAGDCTVTVRARGFEAWSIKTNLRQAISRSIKAVLSVGQQCAGCLTVRAEEEIEFKHLVPEEAILAIPMELASLPAHRLRIHRRTL